MGESSQLAPVGVAYSRDQIELLKRTLANGATDDELQLFLMRCRTSGLDPFAGQIHFTKRKGKMVIQTGIDGFRAQADQTGTHAGTDEPVYTGEGIWDNGRTFPLKATVTVWKMVDGVKVPFTASCFWSEYYPGDDDNTGWMWRKMPYNQLGKCAEAQSLRKAFPQKLGGMYSDVELDQAANDDRPPAPVRTVRQGGPAQPTRPALSPKAPTPEPVKEFSQLSKDAGKSWADVMAWAKNEFGFSAASPKTKFSDVPPGVIEAARKWLEGLRAKPAAEVKPIENPNAGYGPKPADPPGVGDPKNDAPADHDPGRLDPEALEKLGFEILGSVDAYEVWLHKHCNGTTPEMVGMMNPAGRFELREKLLAIEKEGGFSQEAGSGIPQ